MTTEDPEEHRGSGDDLAARGFQIFSVILW
jgi:hypothetical protein